MKIMERIALGRTVYLVLAVIGLLIFGAVYTIFGTEADFAQIGRASCRERV